MKVTECKTIFARYQDVKQGLTFDAEGESLSHVEQSLNNLGIALRSDSGTFRDYGDVIAELSGKWKNLTSVQQSDMAKSMAGTRQRENFIVLMNNMTTVTKLQTDQMNASGSAMTRYGEFSKSTEAKFNDLTNASQKMWLSMLHSSTINSFIGGMTNIVTVMGRVATGLGSTNTMVLLLTSSLILLNAKAIGSLITNFIAMATGETILSVATVGLSLAVESLGTAMLALLTNPVTWIIASVGLVVAGIVAWTNKQQKLKEQTDAMTQSQKNLNQAIKDQDMTSMKTEYDKQKKEYDKMDKLNAEYVVADAKNKELLKKSQSGDKTFDQTSLMESARNMVILTKEVNAQKASMGSLTDTVDDYNTAKMLLGAQGNADKINKESEAMMANKDAISSSIQEYQTLSNIEDKNATQKERLSQLSGQLEGKISGLKVVRDKEGNSIISNTDLLGKQLSLLKTEGTTVETLANVKLTNAKNEAVIEIGKTKMTYLEVKKRIAMYQEETKSAEDAIDSAKTQVEKDNATRGAMYAGSMGATLENNYSDALEALDKIYALPSASTGDTSSFIPESTEEDTKAMTALEKAVASANKQSNAFERSLAQLSLQMKLQDNQLTKLNEHSKEYRDGLEKKAKLIQAEITLTERSIVVNNANAKSIAKLEISDAKASGTTTISSVSTGGSKNTTSGYYAGGYQNGKYKDLINASGSKWGIDPNIIAGIIQTENSSWNPSLPSGDGLGSGLGQFGISTAKWMGLKDRNDPTQTIDAMGKLLNTLLASHGGNMDDAIRAYNGSGAVTYKYLAKVKNNTPSSGGQGTYSPTTTTTTNSGSGEVSTSASDSILSTIEQQKQSLIDLQEELLAIPYQIFQSVLGEYDDRVSDITTKIGILQNESEQSQSGTTRLNNSVKENVLLKEEMSLTQEKERFIRREIDSRKYTNAQVAEMNTELLGVLSTEQDIYTSLRQQEADRLAIIATAESKVTEIIQKQVELRKKAITDQYDTEKKALEDTQALYNKTNTTDDYNKNLKTEQSALSDINAEITSASRDTSFSGQARLKTLNESKTTQQAVIDEMVLNRGRDVNNENFDTASTNLDTQQQDKLDALDVKYSDEEIAKMSANAVQSGQMRDLNDNIISITQAYVNFENEFGEGMKASGESVKVNLIAVLTEAKGLFKVLADYGAISPTTGKLPGFKEGLDNVPYDDFEARLHKDEGVLTAPENVQWKKIKAMGILNDLGNATTGITQSNKAMNFSIPKMNSVDMSSVGSSKSAGVTFNEPLISIAGNVDSNMMPDLNALVSKASDMVVTKINGVFSDFGLNNH